MNDSIQLLRTLRTNDSGDLAYFTQRSKSLPEPFYHYKEKIHDFHKENFVLLTKKFDEGISNLKNFYPDSDIDILVKNQDHVVFFFDNNGYLSIGDYKILQALAQARDNDIDFYGKNFPIHPVYMPECKPKMEIVPIRPFHEEETVQEYVVLHCNIFFTLLNNVCGILADLFTKDGTIYLDFSEPQIGSSEEYDVSRFLDSYKLMLSMVPMESATQKYTSRYPKVQEQLYEITCDFILYHEFSHAWARHDDKLIDFSKYPNIGKDILEAMIADNEVKKESQADRWALHTTIFVSQQKSRLFQVPLGFALFLMLNEHLSRSIGKRINDTQNDTHPPSQSRIEKIMEALAELDKTGKIEREFAEQWYAIKRISPLIFAYMKKQMAQKLMI